MTDAGGDGHAGNECGTTSASATTSNQQSTINNQHER